MKTIIKKSADSIQPTQLSGWLWVSLVETKLECQSKSDLFENSQKCVHQCLKSFVSNAPLFTRRLHIKL
jgi:hypothetical protein